MIHGSGVALWFETEPDGALFCHITADGSWPWGKARFLRAAIPVGCWVTVPPPLQPSMTRYLMRKVGFAYRARLLLDDGVNDVLQKER